MRISDLQLGQTGFYAHGAVYRKSQIHSVKFVQVTIEGEEYVCCIQEGGEFSRREYVLKKKLSHFFGGYGDFCDCDSERYNKNYECFLDKEEAFLIYQERRIETKIKKLDEEKNSLLKLKEELLETERKILEKDFEKAKLELEKEKLKIKGD